MFWQCCFIEYYFVQRGMVEKIKQNLTIKLIQKLIIRHHFPSKISLLLIFQNLNRQDDKLSHDQYSSPSSSPSASTESKETDIERKKREADELLKGIIPDDVIDGTAGLHCFFSKIFFFVYLFNDMNTFMFKSHQPSYEFVSNSVHLVDQSKEHKYPTSQLIVHHIVCSGLNQQQYLNEICSPGKCEKVK